MELDDLKTKWSQLDERLEKMDNKIDKLAADVVGGKFISARQQLLRINRIGIFLLMSLPLWMGPLSSWAPGTSLGISLNILGAFFIFTMLIRQIILLVLLRRINPDRQSVREVCAAVLRFRRCFFAGVIIGIGLGVPFLILIGIQASEMSSPYTFYGFITGLIIGLPLGIRIFIRVLREIRTLRTALQDTE